MPRNGTGIALPTRLTNASGSIVPEAAGRISRAGSRSDLGEPDVADLLEVKSPTLGAVADAGRNELAFRRQTETSPILSSVNLELTNHCNLRCTICPVNTT